MQRDDEHLIKGNAKLSKEDENMLREKFVNDYARKKGWDKTNLTPTQMLEIVQQGGYKNPGMILS
jgi:hypothetical protein